MGLGGPLPAPEPEAERAAGFVEPAADRPGDRVAAGPDFSDLVPRGRQPAQAPARGPASGVDFSDLIPQQDDGPDTYGVRDVRRQLGQIFDATGLATLAKQIIPGAIESQGTALKGLSALNPGEAVASVFDRYRADIERVPQMSEAEVGALRQRIAKEQGGPKGSAAFVPLIDAIDGMRSGELTRETLAQQYPRATPVEERSFYRAGRSVAEFAEGIAPPPPGYENSTWAQLGKGLGSMLGGLPASLIGGPVGGAVVFGGMGAGEALDRAIKFDQVQRAAGREGLTEQQKLAAAVYGIGPGVTDVAPIELMLGRLKLPAALTPEVKSAMARVIGRIGGQAFIEGIQEGPIQQSLQNLISWAVYNPNQDLTEDILSSFGIGAGVGAIAQGGVEAGRGLMRVGRRSGGSQTQPEPGQPPPLPEQAPAGAQPPPLPPGSAPEAQTPGGPVPASHPPANASESEILRAQGWSDADIADMDPAQRAQEIADARRQNGELIGDSPLASPSALAPDRPSAEPIADLMAQARDVVDPSNQRQGLYLPAASLDTLSEHQARQLRQVLGEGRGSVDDGQGGFIITRNQAIADQAQRAIQQGADLQQVIGVLTGAGTGKPADGTAVVQQVTPQGAVTRERVVNQGGLESARQEFQAPGREVRTVTPEEALDRRAAGGPPPLPTRRAEAEQTAEGEVIPPQRRGSQPTVEQQIAEREQQLQAINRRLTKWGEGEEESTRYILQQYARWGFEEARATSDKARRAFAERRALIRQALDNNPEWVERLDRAEGEAARLRREIQSLRATGRLPGAQKRTGARPPPLPADVDLSNAGRGPGSPAAPIAVERAQDLDVAGLRVQEPTEGQAAAGNYRKAHVNFAGLDVTIETPKGGTRRKVVDGREVWRVDDLPAAYGYVKRTKGADGDQVDVYIGDNPASQRVFVVDQVDPESGAFDEHKVILGTDSEQAAGDLYSRGFSDGRGPDRIGGITEMGIEEFKAWLAEDDTTERLSPEASRDMAEAREAAAAPTAPAAASESAGPTDDEIQNILELDEEDIAVLVDDWEYIKGIQANRTRDVKRLKIVEELRKELARYGIDPDKFDTAEAVRRHLGEEGQGAAESDPGDQGQAAAGEARGGPAERDAAGAAEPAAQRPAATGSRAQGPSQREPRAVDGEGAVRSDQDADLQAAERPARGEGRQPADGGRRGAEPTERGSEVGAEAEPKDQPFLLGQEEWVAIPSLGIPQLKARVDTGAETSSLHAEDIQRRGKEVSFVTVGGKRVTAEVLRDKTVRNANGKQKRTIIEVTMRLGGREYPVEVTLADRGRMTYPFLLGRQALQDDMLVKPKGSFLQGEPEAEKKPAPALEVPKQGDIFVAKRDISFRIDGKGRVIEIRKGDRLWSTSSQTLIRSSGNVTLSREGKGQISQGWPFSLEQFHDMFEPAQDAEPVSTAVAKTRDDFTDALKAGAEEAERGPEVVAPNGTTYRLDYKPKLQTYVIVSKDADAGGIAVTKGPGGPRETWTRFGAASRAADDAGFSRKPERPKQQMPETARRQGVTDEDVLDFVRSRRLNPRTELDEARAALKKVEAYTRERGMQWHFEGNNLVITDRAGEEFREGDREDFADLINEAARYDHHPLDEELADRGADIRTRGEVEAEAGDPLPFEAQPEAETGREERPKGPRVIINTVPTEAPETGPSDSGATGFTTAKGSTYVVHEDGTTTRNKAARGDPGHEGQQGPQPRSERTFYVDPKDAQRLAPPDGEGIETAIVNRGDGTLAVASRYKGKPWGMSPESRSVPVTTAPEIGKVPVELWGKRPIQKFDAYKRIHLGNPITEIEQTTKPEPGGETETQAESDADALRNRLMGEGFKTITEARTWAKEHGIEATGKELDEVIELAVVQAAREIVADNAGDPKATFQALVGLYERQPRLGTRTSTSVTNQAYSTPVPLAYLASRLAGVAGAKVVLEPTAGNGALLIEADPQSQKVIANELDERRAEALEAQGFEVATADATELTPEELGKITTLEGKADAIVMNPPFGAVREGGQSKTFDADGLTTTAVDHAIALTALRSLADKGRAVMILGGVKAESVEERRRGYRGQAKRTFFHKLYNSYNVTDHFAVAGDLYDKQGAGFPVDVVVIDGRAEGAPGTSGKSARKLPAAEPPTILNSWDELEAKLDAEPVQQPAADQQAAGPTPEGVGEPAPGDAQLRAAPRGRGAVQSERPAGDGPGRVRSDRARGEPAPERAPAGAAERVPARADRQPAGSGEPSAAGAQRSRVAAKVETRGGQTTYAPASEVATLDTLVPENIAGATREALKRVANKHGSVDAFVADRLGYQQDELGRYFGAEQVDALAVAIDNVERGAAMVLGDATGIGKGRVGAGMMAYAMQRGMIPVLMTEKPDLFGDMIRDMNDIGLTEKLGHEPLVFMTNTGETVPLDEDALAWKQEADEAKAAGEPLPKRRGKFLTGGGKARQEATMRAILEGEKKMGSEGMPDVVMSTYDQMNTVKGMTTARQGFLSRIAPRALIVFDECVPAGTMIATPDGECAIESLKLGDLVLGFSHDDNAVIATPVLHLFRRHTQEPLFSVGPVQMTGNHPVYVDKAGYIPAGEIDSSAFVLYMDRHAPASKEARPHLRILREIVPEQGQTLRQQEPVLQPSVHGESARRDQQEQPDAHPQDAGICCGTEQASLLGGQPVQRSADPSEGRGARSSAWLRTSERGEWQGTDEAAAAVGKPSGLADRVCRGGEAAPEGPSEELQDRSRGADPQDSDRGGWRGPQSAVGESQGRQEDRIPAVAGLDRASVHQQARAERLRRRDQGSDGGCRVYNIETGTANYFANGLLVHNCHNAGGTPQTGYNAGKPKAGRAGFVRALAREAGGVMFASATYAKRPDVMDLYARTDMGKAVSDPSRLPDLISKGGVPMQQIVASMLSDAGQYLRRERSFDGVEYAVQGVPVPEATYTQFSEAVRAVFKFDLAVSDWRDKHMKDILDNLGSAKSRDAGTGDAAAHSTAFSSIMHNIVAQMLLAIKAKQTADQAIAAAKAGEKPVIYVSNTMEAFITDFTATAGIKDGDVIDLDFGDVLKRYLSRTMRITVKDGAGNTEHVQVPTEALPTHLRKMYDAAEDTINEGEFSDLPVSPIDAMRAALAKAGLSVAEVTGRKTMVDYGVSPPRYVTRPKREMGPAGKRSSIAAFNRGTLDALIINRSGSTGVSMHAAKGFKDQRRRRMLIAQPDANIDTHLQALGRVHRTGQVIPPAYSQIAAEIPAEARPTAVLMKKMASLNANTTGARGSVFMSDAVDFMNEIGDAVWFEALIADPELDGELGGALKMGENGPVAEDAARRATGRLVLLDPDKQADVLERVTQAYKAEIARLDSLGENPLEAKTLDLQARPISETILKDKAGDGPFLDAARMEKMSVKAQGRAHDPDEVVSTIAKAIKVDEPQGDAATALRAMESQGRQWAAEQRRQVGDRARAWIASDVAAKSVDVREAVKKRHDDMLDRWIATLQVAAPGARVTLKLQGADMAGIVMGVVQDKKGKHPTALSTWTVKVAVPDSAREIHFPMSRLYPPGVAKGDTESGTEIAPSTIPHADLVSQFEEARKEGREERYIATGNILAAYDQLTGRGRIINFTTESGELRPGVLMERGFNQEKFLETRAITFNSGLQVAQFLEAEPKAEVRTTDGIVTMHQTGQDGDYLIFMPASRAKGGRYYTEKTVQAAVRDEFVKRGDRMQVVVDRNRLVKAIGAMRTLGALFETREAQEVAQEIAARAAREEETARTVRRSVTGDMDTDSGSDPDFGVESDWQSDHWAELSRQSHLIDVAVDVREGGLAAARPVSRSVLELEADQLFAAARARAAALEGQSPEAIAQAMTAAFGAPVTAEQVRSGETWWNALQGPQKKGLRGLLSQDQYNELKALWADPANSTQDLATLVSEMTGQAVTEKTMSWLMRANRPDFPARATGRPSPLNELSSEDRAEIKRLWAAQASMPEMVEFLSQAAGEPISVTMLQKFALRNRKDFPARRLGRRSLFHNLPEETLGELTAVWQDSGGSVQALAQHLSAEGWAVSRLNVRSFVARNRDRFPVMEGRRGFWTSQRIERMAGLWADGQDLREIARSMSEPGRQVSPLSVKHIMHLNRELFPVRDRAWSAAERKLLASDRIQALSHTDAAAVLSAELGRPISRDAVTRARKRDNLSDKRTWAVRGLSEAEIEALSLLGDLSNNAAAEALTRDFGRPISRHQVFAARQKHLGHQPAPRTGVWSKIAAQQAEAMQRIWAETGSVMEITSHLNRAGFDVSREAVSAYINLNRESFPVQVQRDRFWTPPRVAEMQRLWGEGALAEAIAEAMSTETRKLSVGAIRVFIAQHRELFPARRQLLPKAAREALKSDRYQAMSNLEAARSLTEEFKLAEPVSHKAVYNARVRMGLMDAGRRYREALAGLDAAAVTRMALTEGQAADRVDQAIKMGRTVTLKPEVYGAVHAALAPMRPFVPFGFDLIALKRIEPIAGTDQVTLTFVAPTGEEHQFDQSWEKWAKGTSAFAIDRSSLLGSERYIGFIRYTAPSGVAGRIGDEALGAPAEVGGGGLDLGPLLRGEGLDLVRSFEQGLRGELAHETVHAVWSSVPEDARARLIDHATTLQVLDMTNFEYLIATGRQALAMQLKDRTQTRLDIYQHSLRHLPDKDKFDILLEEEVAHMVELAFHGGIPDAELAAIRADLNTIFAIARKGRQEALKPGEEKFAYRFSKGADEAQPAAGGEAAATTGAPTPAPELRTNADGWVMLLPFKDRWGDPRFDAGDKDLALGRLIEIGDMNVRRVPWDDLVEARRDINEILAQLSYYAPDVSADALRKDPADFVWDYLYQVYSPEDHARGPAAGRPAFILDANLPDDLKPFRGAARRAVDNLTPTRRAGVNDLMRWGKTEEPARRQRPGPQPETIAQRLPSGFYFQAGRKLAEVPDTMFSMGGQHVINWLRKNGIGAAELEHFRLQERFGDTMVQQGGRASRAEFAQAIAERMFDFRRKTRWLNPERSQKDYDLAGTRAFRGPRIPGRGLYFEATKAFPKTLKGGEAFAPGFFDGYHWDDFLKGTWLSWRGSLREVPGFGRVLVGEEGQSDFMQGANVFRDTGEARRPRIPQAEHLANVASKKPYERVMNRAYDLVNEAVTSTDALTREQRDEFRKDLAPSTYQGREWALDTWMGALNLLRTEIREEARRFDPQVSAWKAVERPAKALDMLDRLEALRRENEAFFAPGALDRFKDPESSFTPATPIDATYVRVMARDLLLMAAEQDVDAVAIATTDTNDRIQMNTQRSAGHFYDGQLKPSLEHELRRITGRKDIALEEVKLPKAQGGLRERPYTVWAVRLDAATRQKLREEGLPMMQALPTPPPIPRISGPEQASLARDIESAMEIVGRIAGPVEVRFAPQIDVADVRMLRPDQRAATASVLGDAPATAGGFYRMAIDGPSLIGLAYQDPLYDLLTNAGHEAWHHVEVRLATGPERVLLESASEMARMKRQYVAPELGWEANDPRLDVLPGYEVRAVAFQRYRRMREEGIQPSNIHMGIRRLWDRITRILQSVRNLLAKRGYNSFEAIFELARTGELANRLAQSTYRSEGLGDGYGQTLPGRIAAYVARAAGARGSAAEGRSGGDRASAVGEGGAGPGGPAGRAAGRAETAALERFLDASGLTASPAERARARANLERLLAERGVSLSDNHLWEAVKAHVRLERRAGNPLLQSNVTPAAITAGLLASSGIGIAAMETGQPVAGAAAIGLSAAVGYLLLKNHTRDTKAIWDRLRGMQGREEETLRAMLSELLADSGQAQTPQTGEATRAEQATRSEVSDPDGDEMASLIPSVLSRQINRIAQRVSPRSDAVRVKVQDRFLPVRRIEERIEAQTGTKLPVNLSTYVAEALYHGRAGEQLTDLDTKWVEPLIAKLRAADLTMEDLGEYLYARHAAERNAAIAKIDPDNLDGSGMSDAEAQAILDGVNNGPKRAAYEAAARIVDDMQSETRDTLLRSGLIDRETYDNWSTQYLYYVPLRGWEMGSEDNPERPRTGVGFDIRGPEARRALGRRSKADNPAAFSILQAMQAIIRAEKNRVDKTLYRMIQANPDPNLWKIYKGEYRRRLNPETGLVETYFVPPAFVHADNIHGVKIGGKQHFMELKDPGLSRAMRGVGYDKTNALLNGMMKLSRFYAKLLTSYNPEFIVSNYFRDVETALINAGDIAEKPKAVRRQIAKEALSLKSIRGVMAALYSREGRTIFGTARAADETAIGTKRSAAALGYARWFEEFRQAGGKISFMEFNDVERIKDDITKSINRGRMMGALKKTAKVAEDLNTAVENGVRLSTYIALRKAGVGQDRAAFVARELTVNFNRRGEWGPAINAAYIFFNASAQGTVRIAQALTRSKAVRYAVAGIFSAGLALDLFNYLAAGDDDDGENAYDKIPAWIKERNLLLMIPGGSPDDRIMIPLAYGYNVPFLAGQQVAALARKAAGFGAEKVTPLNAAARVFAAAWDSFNPVGAAATAAQFAAPTLADPFVQVWENKTWFGGPITPRKFEPHKPNSENFFTTAPFWAVDTARFLNAASGGNRGKAGLIDVSPDVIEHFFEFAGGGVAKFVGNAVASGHRTVRGEEWLPEKTPFLRRLYGKSTGASRRRDFYEAWQEVDRARYEYLTLGKSGEPELTREVLQRHAAELAVYGQMRAVQRSLAGSRRERDRINLNRDLTEQDRKAQIEAIQKRENGIILQALGAYNRAKRKPQAAAEPALETLDQ